VDVETTGLDAQKDAIIELACVPFDYGREDGRIFAVQPPVSYFEDPGRPIPAQVTALTGITDEDVRGKRIDDEVIARIAGEASLIIAHNARFDRPFLERRLSCFAEKPWACSVNEIPWKRLGCSSSSLEFLLYKSCGEFFDAHRAADDCLAAIHVLATAARTGELPMRQLLDAARRDSYVIRATGSPIECKDMLKARGYRWKPSGDNAPGAWWIELDSEARDAELAWLSSNAYPSRTPTYRVERRTARDRYRS
jgi:DNA polymerase-3 subunit epsilon